MIIVPSKEALAKEFHVATDSHPEDEKMWLDAEDKIYTTPPGWSPLP
jgi:hypothetical protein